MEITDAVRSTLSELIVNPSLALARQLEQQLMGLGYHKEVFGRINQKSSIEAASESDRGVTERIANAFDASLTAARRLAGIQESDPSLTPRKAAQRFLNPNLDDCSWAPQRPRIDFRMPVVQFWREEKTIQRRFKRYHAESGLCTFLVRDFSLGIGRDEMPQTILALNSESKLRTWEAIGQFGHGGSSALAFCESCLVVAQPRFGNVPGKFYWTLIFPDPETDVSKQAFVIKWFADHDGLPLIGNTSDFPALAEVLPGTSIWHFGYDSGDWIKTAVGTHQDTPAGRLGRLLFSYPLLFQIQGALARGDTDAGTRPIKGAFFRLMDERTSGKNAVEYRTGEKSERLIIDNVDFGQFSVFAFVLSPNAEVRNYVDRDCPVILTLHGQNHGEIRRTLLINAGLSELASSMIVEIRLDGLDRDALSEIINNSRETPKTTQFTRILKQRVQEVLRADEVLASIERRRQEEKARQTNSDLNQRIASFLSAIISDARAMPGIKTGNDGLGGTEDDDGPTPKPRPEIPAADPPVILEFIGDGPLYVSEGTAILAKFKSDARPPKYSFHGDNPRCFAKLEINDEQKDRLLLSGKADINKHGYGSVTLTALELSDNPITEQFTAGMLHITIQSTDGRVLKASLPLGLRPKPELKRRKHCQAVVPEIRFCAPTGCDVDELKDLFGEDQISDFGASYLGRYRDALGLSEADCAYWGEKAEINGASKLVVEINAAHPQLQHVLKVCKTAEERILAKEGIVRDVVLDCYQHSFRLEDLPATVHEQVFTEPEDAKRAAEICLNFDKVLRITIQEKEKTR